LSSKDFTKKVHIYHITITIVHILIVDQLKRVNKMPIILYGCKNEEPLLIRVKNNDGKEMNYEVSKSTKMNNVFRHYAALCYGPNYYKSIGITSSIQQSIDISSLEFRFNHKLISETDTCQSLQLREGDQIDCYTRSEIIVLELLRQCESGISSGDVLMEKIKDLPRHSIIKSSFVHQAMAIMSGNTPLKFMEHLIRDFPDEAPVEVPVCFVHTEQLKHTYYIWHVIMNTVRHLSLNC